MFYILFFFLLAQPGPVSAQATQSASAESAVDTADRGKGVGREQQVARTQGKGSDSGLSRASASGVPVASGAVIRPGAIRDREQITISYSTLTSTSTFPLTPLAQAAVGGQAGAGAATPVILISTEAVRQKILAEKTVRGIHLTCWGAGSAKSRWAIIARIKKSVINAVVVAVKETDGKVYIPGIAKTAAFGSYKAAIPDPEEMVSDFKAAKLYTIARIVLFKDKIVPKKRKDLAVRTPEGDLWRSYNGATWTDPYNREVWDYNLEVAARAAEAGFDEIQFDYLRYPSEGNTARCRYSKPHTKKTAMANLGEFFKYAGEKLKLYNVKISVDVFGLTTTVKNDMGIGQDIGVLAENADYVYPMMYPSHYYPGLYGLKNPNSQPYKVINHGLKDAYAKLGFQYAKIRPYLQDFSLGRPHYGPAEVRAQMVALRRNMLESWILWNPGNKYTWNALTPQYYRAFVDPGYESVTAK